MQIDRETLMEVEAALGVAVERADQFLAGSHMPNDFDAWKVEATAALARLRKAMEAKDG